MNGCVMCVKNYRRLWSRFLSEKLDNVASEKIVDLDDKYKEAMEHLRLFFGVPYRVVESSVMQEVMSPGRSFSSRLQ